MSKKPTRKCRCRTIGGRFRKVYFNELYAMQVATRVSVPTRVYKCPTTKNFHITGVKENKNHDL